MTNKKLVDVSGAEIDTLLELQHLQYLLNGKGDLLIRTEDSGLWFVNCHVWKDIKKYQEDRRLGSNSDNVIYIYRNYVSDLQEAIHNCVKLLHVYEKEN